MGRQTTRIQAKGRASGEGGSKEENKPLQIGSMDAKFNHPAPMTSPSEKKETAFGQIVVTKGNPSRGEGFEISHFVRRNGTVRSVSRLDLFVPTMRKASAWVHRYHPSAKLVGRKKDHFGHIAALCFECSLRELLRPINEGKSVRES